ncbi:MAG TPA: D-2-hydroxyacid dehydrogenase, partial [Polyangiaceae bacterium]
TILIVGLGRIGEALAKRAKAFDVKMIGVKRSPDRRHDESIGVDRVVGLADLDAVLPEADHVVLALPLTGETRHLFDARRIARMKRDAFLYNVGRGALVDEPALVQALIEKRIAGAGLDVFEEEPLPAESPLWKLENVILTPHVSGITPRYYERAAAIFGRNLRKFLDGAPLENRFDPARGY